MMKKTLILKNQAVLATILLNDQTKWLQSNATDILDELSLQIDQSHDFLISLLEQKILKFHFNASMKRSIYWRLLKILKVQLNVCACQKNSSIIGMKML